MGEIAVVISLVFLFVWILSAAVYEHRHQPATRMTWLCLDIDGKSSMTGIEPGGFSLFVFGKAGDKPEHSVKIRICSEGEAQDIQDRLEMARSK